MSILFAVVIIIMAGFALHGYIRGLVRVVFSLVSIFLTIGLVYFITPHVSQFLTEKTTIHQTIRDKCIEKVQLRTEDELSKKTEEQEKITFAGMELPEEVQQFFSHKGNETADSLLEESGVYEKMGDYIAGVIVKGIAFIITFVIVVLVLRLIVNLLDIAAKLPVLNSVNHLGGLAAGLIEGVVIVWVIFFIITLSQSSPFGQQLLSSIDHNIFLRFLYENNGIEYLMLRILL